MRVGNEMVKNKQPCKLPVKVSMNRGLGSWMGRPSK